MLGMVVLIVVEVMMIWFVDMMLLLFCGNSVIFLVVKLLNLVGIWFWLSL